MVTLRRPRNRRETTLAGVKPNAGITADYQRRLIRLINEMERSTLYWVRAAYRANEPEIASDESPAAALRKVIEALRRRWLARFDEAAKEMADYFGKSVSDRADGALKSILKKAGIAVEFKMTRAQNDIVQATVNANVSLIKSIPRDLLDKVEGHVMRSVQTGRDMGPLAEAIQHQFGATKKRAALIARDQNQKATAALTRARHLELGIVESEWRHSGAGKHPRQSHVKAGKERMRFPVAEGWFDPEEGRAIQPGELINCRCFSRPVIAGFTGA